MFSRLSRSRPAVHCSRHHGVLDHEIPHNTHAACIGVAGAADLIRNLVRTGVGAVTLINPDAVSATNPPTTVPQALSWAIYWAEQTAEYIQTGKSFSSEHP